MHEVKVAIGDGFLESFAVIPKAKQKKVMEFVAKFRHNPKSGGINYEKINDARDPNFRSVRVDQDYRGIVLSPERGDVYVLLWVDKHDDAYDWARRHRCDIHPTTGTLQLLQVQTSIVADAAPAIASQQEAPTAPTRALPSEACDTTVDLFSLDDPTLLRFGVPPGELSRTRALNTVAHLEGAEAWLPREAFEALYLYAAGTPITELLTDFAAPPAARPVDTTDFATALTTVPGPHHRYNDA